MTNLLITSIIITYSFFIFQSLERGVEFKNIIKVVSAIIAPAPMFLFLYFLFSSRDLSKLNFQKKTNKLVSSLILVASLIFTMAFIQIYELFFNKLDSLCELIFIDFAETVHADLNLN